ncbi:hypothetical protein VSS37_17720 [Candidatus Thiothrix sp. Deng01]|uniref:Uncharacterized protein n=1 Tax=Candidatus Thiothrix phosphatis TaxID=3112415 RepID=A0ABU6D3A1_9GAMM|nr:hypothetical protein [Candidatus Thiothrix sp. Deng01]MEB4592822.1 hypothetical protein [Candidatus Thiothrix sp. Deng01]
MKEINALAIVIISAYAGQNFTQFQFWLFVALMCLATAFRIVLNTDFDIYIYEILTKKKDSQPDNTE